MGCHYHLGNVMNMVQNLTDRLRPLVGFKGWDYCVLWKFSDDQRYIELMDCCCAGTEGTQNGGEELHFPVSPVLPCRDAIFHHPRTRSCELLSQLPSSMTLDTGMHAQTLISNVPRWLNFSNNSDSIVHEEIIGTKVLIPVPGGLVELFATKQVPEDQQIVDFVTSQCNFLMDQGSVVDTTRDSSFAVNVDVISENQSKPFLLHEDNSSQKDHTINILPPVPTPAALDNLNLPCDISLDRIRLCSSPMNFLQQFNYSEDTIKTKSDFFFEEVDNGTQELDALQKPLMANSAENMHMTLVESLANSEQQGNDKDSVKHENGPSDSHSDCNDQIDDEDDAKYRRKNGKGPQSKNLVAERKRRRKLNDRLYALRALVPKISKLDRASILGDAIEYVKELQKQEKELHDELEEHSDEDGAKNGNHNNIPPEVLNGFHVEASGHGSVSKQNQDSEITHDKGHQMEPQVEVAQIYGNEFFVKVFCERKPGGFVRLMEALDSLGLEVKNANVTSNRGLVSNVFQVEKKDSEMVQADYVRDSLLEITRNPQRVWPEMVKPSDSCNGIDYHQHQHQLQNGHINSNHHHFHQLRD
ncbi:hypothetical protein Tsubulata_013682 [Turnera subulata]|uniref:BHLH domain-containing protein n=1 Tax=Turnera subulata TaxID=218843 RepID=A0A9Q0FN85_9ROSI|nr:hypothetical protein Tsubulata_013682 [Turnera subulata]